MARKKGKYHHLHKNVHHTNFFLLFILLVAIGSILFASRLLQPAEAPTYPAEPAQQTPKVSAELTFSPLTASDDPYIANLNQAFDIEIQVNPDVHKISVVSPIITYDSTVLRVVSVEVDQSVFPALLQEVDTTQSGVIQFGVGINPPIENAVTNTSRVATIRFQPTARTESGITEIQFDPQSSAYSVDPLDGPSTNVIQLTSPFYLQVQ